MTNILRTWRGVSRNLYGRCLCSQKQMDNNVNKTSFKTRTNKPVHDHLTHLYNSIHVYKLQPYNLET